jgi:hypothetical protein
MPHDATYRRFWLAIAAAAGLALPASLGAQETQRSADTAAMRDTSTTAAAQGDSAARDSPRWGRSANSDPQVQNPPGYRGMERPVNVFPPKDGQDTSTAGAVEDRATGTYDDSAWNDTSAARQNPAGYRGMERAVGRTGADTMGTEAEIEQYRQRLGELGYKVTKMSKSEKKAWKKANPRERDAAGSDTTLVGESSPRVPRDSTRRLPAARGDTTGQGAGTGSDTTGR